MDIRGEYKQSIMDDIFGKKIGSVFESGLSDAGSTEEFIGMLESLEMLKEQGLVVNIVNSQ